jgi:nucleoid-associated protein YgaU
MADSKKPWQKGILDYTKDFLGGMFGRKPTQSQPSQSQPSQSQTDHGSFGTSAGDFIRERAEEVRQKLDQRSGTQTTPRTTQPSTQAPPRTTQQSGGTGAAEQARKSADAIADSIRAAQQEQASGKEGGMAAQVGGKHSYTVLEGDSLSKIALRFYGDAMQWQKIYNANRDKITNPDLIYPGQEFIIP